MKLPKHLYADNHISDLNEGISAWVNPQALIVDSDGECYLNPDFTFERARTHPDKIRVELQPDGTYLADLKNTTWRWCSVTDGMPDSYRNYSVSSILY